MPVALVRTEKIRKDFSTVTVLKDISIELQAGETLGLIGENGAGKSTLMKILSGLYQPTSGTLHLGGQATVLRGPRDAKAAGISIVPQEFNLCPDLSVSENIYLGDEIRARGGLLDRAAMRARTGELLAGLSSWSPAMRKRSAEALGKREGDFLAPLQKLLAAPDRYGRYGACEALGCLGVRADAAAPQLRALLKDPDPWVESLACSAISHLGADARKASADDLLLLAARKNPADPRAMAHRAVSCALFSPSPGTRDATVLNNSLDGVDRRLLYPAMVSLLQNEDSIPRGALGPYLPKLTGRDLAVMLPAIVKAVEIMSPTDEMFADGIRCAGLDLLSNLHIREGMNLCVSTLEFRWGLQWEKRMECLMRYGANAKAVLPQLRKKRPEKWPEGALKFDKYIADIEAKTETPKLVSLRDFIAKASTSRDASKNTKSAAP